MCLNQVTYSGFHASEEHCIYGHYNYKAFHKMQMHTMFPYFCNGRADFFLAGEGHGVTHGRIPMNAYTTDLCLITERIFVSQKSYFDGLCFRCE